MLAATGAPTAGTSNIMTSTDGATWTTHTTENSSWGGIAWSPELGIFAATSWTDGGGISMISTPPSQKKFIQDNPFTTYTPTVTATTGTFTSVSATGRYKVANGLVFFRIGITITTNNSAAGHVRVTLPIACGSLPYTCYGYANTTSGKMLSGFILANTTTLQISNYDFTYPGASGETFVISGFYETN